MGAIFSCLSGICNSIANGLETLLSGIGSCFSGIIEGIRNCIVGTCNYPVTVVTARSDIMLVEGTQQILSCSDSDHIAFGFATQGRTLFCVVVSDRELQLKDPELHLPSERCCLVEPLNQTVHVPGCDCQAEEGWSGKVRADLTTFERHSLQQGCQRPVCQGLIQACVVVEGGYLQLYSNNQSKVCQVDAATTAVCGPESTYCSRGNGKEGRGEGELSEKCCAGNKDSTCGRSVEGRPPGCQEVATASPALTKLALLLAVATGMYCLVEGVLSVTFAARDKSVSLGVFGADSIIEIISTAFVIWRLAGCGTALFRERIGTFCIGVLLVLLFLAAVAASVVALAKKEHPESTTFNIIIASTSTVLLLCAWHAKLRIAGKIGSPTLSADANCSFACARLSLVLLVGSLIYRFVHSAWWIDAAAALVLSIFFLKEGIEGMRHALSSNFAGGCGCG